MDPLTAELTEVKEKKKKNGPKNYSVAVPTGENGQHSLFHTRKSSPAAAASAAVRAHIGSFELGTAKNVYVKSRSHYHPYVAKRTGTQKRHKRFSISKAAASQSSKDKTDMPTVIH